MVAPRLVPRKRLERLLRRLARRRKQGRCAPYCLTYAEMGQSVDSRADAVLLYWRRGGSLRVEAET
jgi:hypothetical protein